MPVVDASTFCEGAFPKYAVISWAGGTETVRIDSCSDNVPQITRAQGDTAAQAFPKGACVDLTDAPEGCTLPDRTALPELTPATIDKPYQQCVTIPGLTENLKLVSYYAPVGMKIDLMGDDLCFSSDGLKSAHDGFPIRVVLGDTTDDECPDVLLTGSLEIIDDCICEEIAIPSITLPAGQVGEPYEAAIPFTGSHDGIKLTADSMPPGLTAQIVGNFVRVFGIPTGRFSQITFALQNACTCDPVAFSEDVTITASCDDGCVYVWAVFPTVSVPGVPVTTRFYPPKSCPKGTTLSLDVFKADGVTPYIPAGLTNQLVLTFGEGDSVYVVQNSDANSELVFKPSAEQQRCLSCCSPSISSQKRVVLSAPSCDILVTVSNQNITQPGLKRSYSIVSPSGCTQAEIRINGTVDGQPFSNVQLVPLPYNFTDSQGTPAGAVANLTFTVIGVGPCANKSVCGSPVNLTTNTTAAPPPSTARGGVLSVVAGPCGSGTAVPCVSLGTCVDLGSSVSVPLIMSNLPAGTAFSLETSLDGGATWPITSPFVSSGPAPYTVVNIGSTSASCPGFSTSGGIITDTNDPNNKFRVRVAGATLPICA